jgi:uncharacterized membrane protein
MNIVVVIVLFLIFDFLYVSTVASKYSMMISNIQNAPFQINAISAMLSYVVLIITLVFVVFPYATKTINSDRSFTSLVKASFFTGFLIGFAIYGVFNTTNVAIFKDYSIALALLDTLWGSTLFFIVTLLYLSPSVLFIFKSSK